MHDLMEACSQAVRSRLGGPSIAAAGLLACSILVSAAVVFLRSERDRTLREFGAFMFPRDIIRHSSARADILFWVTRKLLMLPLTLPVGITVAASVGYATHKALLAVFGPGGTPAQHPGLLVLSLFTASMLLAYDVSYYAYHTLQHRVPVLWELHKVHHSAEVMVGTTKDRVHPVDEMMNKAWDGLITGPVYGLWLFQIVDPVELTILGINVYILRNIIMMDFVRHTHLKVSFGRVLNQVVLCPHYHQLHHSTNPKHYDRNFGLMLTIWDRIFGTLAKPEPDETFEFGLPDREAEQYQSLYGLYVLPLRKVALRLSGIRLRADAARTPAAQAKIRQV